jgi:YidC/Oxa1 family membrane protein insertase
MHALYTAIVYTPLYNGLIAFVDHVPNADVGIAVIIFTIIVKIILFPLSYKSVKAQVGMKQLEVELNQLKAKYTDKQEQARQVMAFYKEKGVNPFSGFLLILIQFPILIGLYSVFRSGLPHINTDILYSFVRIPDMVNMKFLNLIDIAKPSTILALIASICQYFQISYAMPKPAAPVNGNPATFKDDLAKSMQFQMKFIMPIFIFIFSFRFIAVIPLYLTISALFAIAQELYVRKTVKR